MSNNSDADYIVGKIFKYVIVICASVFLASFVYMLFGFFKETSANARFYSGSRWESEDPKITVTRNSLNTASCQIEINNNTIEADFYFSEERGSIYKCSDSSDALLIDRECLLQFFFKVSDKKVVLLIESDNLFNDKYQEIVLYKKYR